MVKAAVMPAADSRSRCAITRSPRWKTARYCLRTVFSEVCGTDVHLHHGRLGGVPYPLIPGHVNVGEIVDFQRPTGGSGWPPLREGQIVTFLDVHETCGQCWFCTVAKASTRCPHRRVYGITYSAQEGLLGGWAQMIYLKPGVKVLPLPDSVPPERFIGAGCGLPTAVHAIERADDHAGRYGGGAG